MRITSLALRHRSSALVLLAIVAVGGLFSYVTLPKESAPAIEIPIVVVTTLYPGASPADMESLVTHPIEREIQALADIDEIRSTSTEAVSTIVVEFTPDISVEEAARRVRERVDVARPDLPADVEDPLIREIDFALFPIMTVNLAANFALAALHEVADDLKDELESIPEVLEVELVGGVEREVQVNVDLTALQSYGITFTDVVDAIRRENVDIPGGSVEIERFDYTVRVRGRFQRPEEAADVPIAAPGGRVIYVRDVARVVFGLEDRESAARLRVMRREEGGRLIDVPDRALEQVIALDVKKRAGRNILDAAEAVRRVLERYPLPPGVEVVITGDQSENVRRLVNDLENNILSGLIFVVGVLFFFLGMRNATLVGIAIPLSMCLAFLVFAAMGQTLNFVILFSLIIALGMLVDNAIVVVENIHRFRERGADRWVAAEEATAEVGGAVAASTATTLAAFVPMLFWPGVIGEFMSFLPLTLIVTLSASLFVALVINPVVTGYFGRVEGEARPARASPAARWAMLALLALGALIIGLANPVSLMVLGGGAALLLALHRLFLDRLAHYFAHDLLPRAVARYRDFLGWMLERDYGAKAALLRNGAALGALAAGVLALVAGAGVGAALGPRPAMVLTLPGMVLVGLGVLGVSLHAAETVLLGRWASVKVGLVLAGLMGAVLILLALSPRALGFDEALRLMVLPATIVLLGLLGALVLRRRTRLILTDHRVRLLSTSFAALIAIFGLYALAPTGIAFFPDTDPNQVQINVTGELGLSLEASDALAREVEGRLAALLEEDPLVEGNLKNVLTQVGVAGDRFFGGGAPRIERSRVTLDLVDFRHRRESSTETLAKLRAQVRDLPGATIEIERDQQGPPTGPPVNIEVSGPDFEEIVRITRELQALLTQGVEEGALEGLVDITDDLEEGRPEIRVEVDRDRAAAFGLDTQVIAGVVRTAVLGEIAGTYMVGEDEYDIRVRLREEDRMSLSDLERLDILHEGQRIPLVTVAELSIGTGLGSITRLDLRRVVTVRGQAAPGYRGPEVLERVVAYLAPYRAELPAGYAMAYTGESEDQAESFGFLTTAFLIGVALILMILVAQFDSVTLPGLIMLAVLLSLIGVVLGLILTRTPFSLFSFIGVISLAGIVVNNAIVLVDYTEKLRARGLDKREAIIEGGATRFRPVLLTAFTTILGLVPLTFGLNIDFVGLIARFEPDISFGSANTQFWGPMGTAIISGLLFGTFLTLVIVPVMYSLVDSVRARVAGMR